MNEPHTTPSTPICPGCGYDLRGVDAGVCPECGGRPAEILRSRQHTQSSRLIFAYLLALTAFMFATLLLLIDATVWRSGSIVIAVLTASIAVIDAAACLWLIAQGSKPDRRPSDRTGHWVFIVFQALFAVSLAAGALS